ncbi:MAG: hypothetical protein M3279_02450 [Actinomycetota bacterium]|nr:hypothetical protein [Actinomycetota bacterium]
MGSVLVVPMAAPAGAADCITPFKTAVENPPPRPTVGQIVSVGPPLTINGDVVAAYATAVADHFANATTSFALCIATSTRDSAERLATCITTSPGVQGAGQVDRYVTVESLTVKVYHDVMLSDAGAIIDCLGISFN